MKSATLSDSFLQSLSIYELRVVLKLLGGTPLNKSSAALVEEIKEIQNGKTPVKKSNRGRKPKYLAYEKDGFCKGIDSTSFERIKNALFGETNDGRKPFPLAYAEMEKPEYKGRKAPAFANGVYAPVKPMVCSPEAEPEIVSAADGIVVTEYDVPYCINYDARVKYPVFLMEKDLVKAYDLETGDRITGYARSKNDGRYTIYEVEKINGEPREKFVRGAAFDLIPVSYPEEIFNLGESDDSACRAIDLFSPIGKGARAVIIEGSRRKAVEIIENISKELVKQAHVIYMPIGVAPEMIGAAIENIPEADIVATDFSQDLISALNRVSVYVERAKRLVEQGENVVIVLYSLDKLYEAFKNFYESDETALDESKNFLCRAKKVKGGGSLTIITAMSKNLPTELAAETERVCNCVVRLSDEIAFSPLDGVDVFASGTTRIKSVLGAEKYDSIEELRNEIYLKNSPAVLNKLFKQMRSNDLITADLDAAIDWVKNK